MHLFLYGESGAGKTFAIDRALEVLSIAPKGFRTRRDPDHTALEMEYNGKKLTLAEKTPEGWRAYPERFDAGGREALGAVRPGDTVLMDELGRMEKDAAGFRQAVLDTLLAPCRVIGVVKDEDIPFMREVRKTPCVRAVPVSLHTRAEAYRIVRDFLRPRTLQEALGVGIGITAAVGGGGKTTLLERLGRELATEDKVILTTTTHMAVPEGMPWAEDAEALWPMLAGHNLVFAGKRQGDRVGPTEASMETLFSMCDHLLVEADGSKMLPIKAHASHEPALPADARVISVMGASGFGRPIAEVVHRPELFARALSVHQNELVTGELLARAAVRAGTVLINQVETPERLREARAFARARRRGRTVLASLQSEHPVIEIWEGDLCVW